MRRSLAHLPKRKKKELRAVTAAIVEMVPSTQMVVLFGSHARGDWVEDVYEQDGRIYEYASDYDILVVPESLKIADSTSLWSKVERKIRSPGISETWTMLIVHAIDEVNRKISKSNYFFTDIKKEGICLYSSGKYRLARIRPPDPRERLGMARANFETWLETSRQAYTGHVDAMARAHHKWAAFMLHQASESLYHTLLLVFTGYKPKLHDLEKLGRLTGGFGREMLTVFPTAAEEEKRRFELLRRAYIEARYEPGYRIAEVDLEYLADRVRRLREITQKLCTERIVQYEKEARGYQGSSPRERRRPGMGE